MDVASLAWSPKIKNSFLSLIINEYSEVQTVFICFLKHMKRFCHHAFPLGLPQAFQFVSFIGLKGHFKG